MSTVGGGKQTKKTQKQLFYFILFYDAREVRVEILTLTVVFHTFTSLLSAYCFSLQFSHTRMDVRTHTLHIN